MICPIHGAVPGLKLVCEQCTQARSDKAMEALQAHYVQVVATDTAPLMVIQMFPKGTLDPMRWHIQRMGDRRRTFCGAYIKSFGGMRQTPYSRLWEFTPICPGCNDTLRGLIQASATENAAAS
jgi:hypothetical protein